jgi:hypothetical protein
MSNDGSIIENMDLSHIHLVVLKVQTETLLCGLLQGLHLLYELNQRDLVCDHKDFFRSSKFERACALLSVD